MAAEGQEGGREEGRKGWIRKKRGPLWFPAMFCAVAVGGGEHRGVRGAGRKVF